MERKLKALTYPKRTCCLTNALITCNSVQAAELCMEVCAWAAIKSEPHLGWKGPSEVQCVVAGGLEWANVIHLQHRNGNHSTAVDLVLGILIRCCQGRSQHLSMSWKKAFTERHSAESSVRGQIENSPKPNFLTSYFTLINSDAKQEYLECKNFKRPLNLHNMTATETSRYVTGQALEMYVTAQEDVRCCLKPVSISPWGEKWVKQVVLWHVLGSKDQQGAQCRLSLCSDTGENPRASARGRDVDARASSALAAAASPWHPFSSHLKFETFLIWIWGKLWHSQLCAHFLLLPISVVETRQDSNSKKF